MAINLLIGASSAIARVTRNILLERGESVLAFSRSSADMQHSDLTWMETSHSNDDIENLCKKIQAIDEPISSVTIFLGLLHNEQFMPEKRLEDCDFDRFEQCFRVNTWLPLKWLSQLSPILCSRRQRSLSRVIITAFSARVGSIGDNQLGGWYSYRASKAALNMGLKTAAVELARRAPNTKLVAFHPGTTDTGLSKPFQARVAAEKLFTPEFVAERLLQIRDSVPMDGELSYLDWDNKPIIW